MALGPRRFRDRPQRRSVRQYAAQEDRARRQASALHRHRPRRGLSLRRGRSSGTAPTAMTASHQRVGVPSPSGANRNRPGSRIKRPQTLKPGGRHIVAWDPGYVALRAPKQRRYGVVPKEPHSPPRPAHSIRARKVLRSRGLLSGSSGVTCHSRSEPGSRSFSLAGGIRYSGTVRPLAESTGLRSSVVIRSS